MQAITAITAIMARRCRAQREGPTCRRRCRLGSATSSCFSAVPLRAALPPEAPLPGWAAGRLGWAGLACSPSRSQMELTYCRHSLGSIAVTCCAALPARSHAAA